MWIVCPKQSAVGWVILVITVILLGGVIILLLSRSFTQKSSDTVIIKIIITHVQTIALLKSGMYSITSFVLYQLLIYVNSDYWLARNFWWSSIICKCGSDECRACSSKLYYSNVNLCKILALCYVHPHWTIITCPFLRWRVSLLLLQG